MGKAGVVRRIAGQYPPVNTTPANVRVMDGLPASVPNTSCPECGRDLGHVRLGPWDVCRRCKRPGQRTRERAARARQRAYLEALATWEGEGGALPPPDPKLTLSARGLKRCTLCGAELPLGWFRKNGKGYRGRCRHCERPQKSRDSAIRRSRLNGQVEKVPDNVISLLMARQDGLCACGCRRPVRWRYHVDHRVPLARGGKHELSNLQLLYPDCNLKKGAKL